MSDKQPQANLPTAQPGVGSICTDNQKKYEGFNREELIREIDRLHLEVLNVEQKRSRGAKQLAILTKRLEQKEKEAHWLAVVLSFFVKRDSGSLRHKILGMIPYKWVVATRLNRLSRAQFFDEKNYISRYPDVSQSSIDPLYHYIVHGIKEGRTIEP